MSLARKVDPSQGPRAGAYAFYRDAEQPRWGLTTRVDVAPLLGCLPAWRAAIPDLTAFVAYHHALLRAVDAVPAMRQRLTPEGGVLEWTHADASPAVLRDDDSFAFSRLVYAPALRDFAPPALAAVAQARQLGADWGLRDGQGGATLHTTVLPLVSFTDFSHARHGGFDDATPSMALGRFSKEGARCWMPLNVVVHHAVVDGLHVGRFVQALEALLSEPQRLWSSVG